MRNKRSTYLGLIFLLILTNCSGLKNNTEYEKTKFEIISQNFQNTKSLSIQVIYKKLNGCIDLHQIGIINIKTSNTKIVFNHYQTGKKTVNEQFYQKNNELIEFIIDFEKAGKESQQKCGGISGGTKYDVELKINDKKTKFVFCKKEFDGLNKLINQITTLKKTNANKEYN